MLTSSLSLAAAVRSKSCHAHLHRQAACAATAAAMRFARRSCSGGTANKQSTGSSDSITPATIPADSLFTLEGLRNYRDVSLGPLLVLKRQELRDMTTVKRECEAVAGRFADFCAVGLLVFLSLQTATLFYWVYFLFDWTLVEPITYLLSYSAVWIGIAGYSTVQRELTYDNCREMITAYCLRGLHQRHNFDLQHWQRLSEEVQLLEERLRGLEGV